MASFNANMLMRELRKASGLTQKQIAEGICSRQTISMIESGDRKPDWYTFSNVMRKLNVDPTQYYNNIASKDEMELFNKVEEVIKLSRALDYEGLKTSLDEIEHDERYSKDYGYLILLGLKSSVYGQGPYKNAELALKYSYEFIRIFRPDFEIEKIPEYFLSDSDIKAIQRLALAYNCSNEFEKVLRIKYMLLENFKKNYTSEVDGTFRYIQCTLITNIVRTLVEFVKRYDEAIQVIDNNIDIMKHANMVSLYMYTLMYKAAAYMHLGRKTEGEDAYKRCLMYAHAVDDNFALNMTIENVKSFFKKELGYELDIVVKL